ncbi:MAG: hypothetical protein ACLUI0_11840 [Blautia massiliensis (ex Durand et al. 2017)]
MKYEYGKQEIVIRQLTGAEIMRRKPGMTTPQCYHFQSTAGCT